MSLERAPLYVQSRDLANWLLERTATATRHGPLEAEIERSAIELHARIALALTFPRRRPEHRDHADEEIVRLREVLRIACDRDRLSSRRLRYANASLEQIGRMIGGWQRSDRRRPSPLPSGSGALPARCAPSAAAATGTMPGTAAPRTGTGTTSGTGTGTWGSAPCSPPPEPADSHRDREQAPDPAAEDSSRRPPRRSSSRSR